MPELKSYAVWDVSTRWFHWINALCVIALTALGLVILTAGGLGVTNAGAEGKLLPNGWLFPGRDPLDPGDAAAEPRLVHETAALRAHRQARLDTHIPALLRDSPARERRKISG
ncbi:MAG: hypothetical protein IPF50_17975 [Proteobacteria bacterium]|nr:hypothetical protein [Pseudomonadota bacterium]